MEPNPGQIQQNIKILQEIEEQKRRMRQSHSPIQSQSPTHQIQIATPQQLPIFTQNLEHTANTANVLQQPKQINFSNYLNSNTFGSFINTDSTFGNSILPVLPRF